MKWKLTKYLVVVISPDDPNRLKGKIDDILRDHLDITDVSGLVIITEEETVYPDPPTWSGWDDRFESWLKGAQDLVDTALAEAVITTAEPGPRPTLAELEADIEREGKHE